MHLHFIGPLTFLPASRTTWLVVIWLCIRIFFELTRYNLSCRHILISEENISFTGTMENSLLQYKWRNSEDILKELPTGHKFKRRSPILTPPPPRIILQAIGQAQCFLTSIVVWSANIKGIWMGPVRFLFFSLVIFVIGERGTHTLFASFSRITNTCDSPPALKISLSGRGGGPTEHKMLHSSPSIEIGVHEILQGTPDKMFRQSLFSRSRARNRILFSQYRGRGTWYATRYTG